MPDGTTAKLQMTDAYGLVNDPIIYAKRDCNKCYGRGTRSITNLTTVKQLVGGGTQTHKRPGPNLIRCSCVDKEYAKVIASLPAPVVPTPEVK